MQTDGALKAAAVKRTWQGRIYYKTHRIAESLYRRRKERGFTTRDVAMLHNTRQGRKAMDWARLAIFRLCLRGIVERSYPAEGVHGDRRLTLYSFTEAYLKQWGLDK